MAAGVAHLYLQRTSEPLQCAHCPLVGHDVSHINLIRDREPLLSSYTVQ